MTNIRSFSLVRAMGYALALLAAFGCSRARCKEAGCTAGAQVTYEKAITVPYDLTVHTAGLVLTAHCPVEARSAKQVAPNSASLVCNDQGFMVATANAANGSATQVGNNPVDAKSLTFDVKLVPAGAAPIERSAKVALTHIERPNGPECPSVCYGRQGMLSLEP